MSSINVYKPYSTYLKEEYGEKVYKLPVKLPLTCPNRDGTLGYGGCTYCGEEGGAFENLSENLSVKEQLLKNKDYIGKRYKAKKFIAYFQNYTNTYMPMEEFKKVIKDALIEDIVAISISTRPDCVSKEQLDFLKKIKEEKGIDIIIELGLQSVNYKSLIKINRGHTLAEYIEVSNLLREYGFRNCTHMILNLPWDDMVDVVEGAKIVSALGVDEIKLHSLYIVKNTKMAREYENKEFTLISKDEYKKRVITFLRYLSPDIAIQRLLGRAPEEEVLFENWGESWWKIRDEIVEEMEEKNYRQGDLYNYLGGKGLKKF